MELLSVETAVLFHCNYTENTDVSINDPFIQDHQRNQGTGIADTDGSHLPQNRRNSEGEHCNVGGKVCKENTNNLDVRHTDHYMLSTNQTTTILPRIGYCSGAVVFKVRSLGQKQQHQAGNFLEMLILGHHPGPTGSETLGRGGASKLCLPKSCVRTRGF